MAQLIKTLPVVSAGITSIRHDGKSTLIVNFKDGSSYTYPSVPVSTYHELASAESVGKYFNRFIRQLGGIRR